MLSDLPQNGSRLFANRKGTKPLPDNSHFVPSLIELAFSAIVFSRSVYQTAGGSQGNAVCGDRSRKCVRLRQSIDAWKSQNRSIDGVPSGTRPVNASYRAGGCRARRIRGGQAVPKSVVSRYKSNRKPTGRSVETHSSPDVLVRFCSGDKLFQWY